MAKDRRDEISEEISKLVKDQKQSWDEYQSKIDELEVEYVTISAAKNPPI